MSEQADMVIIGAGPAGMAAALLAAKHGSRVVVLDEQPEPGGQIWRSVGRADADSLHRLGPDYAKGAAHVQAFLNSSADYRKQATVWQVSDDGEVHYIQGGISRTLQAKRVIVCTGAFERPFPVRGWTLPGAMTVGAAQIMLKSAQVAASEPPVLAGCGPLLYLLAWQYLRSGLQLAAIVDTTRASDYVRAMPYLPLSRTAWSDLIKGVDLIRVIRKARVPFFSAASSLAIEGEQQVQALTFEQRGRRHRIETSLVLLHQGVVPNTQFSWSLRAPHVWDELQLCWRPRVDETGRLAGLEKVFVAGDGRKIGGAQLAFIQGELAALTALGDIGMLSSIQLAQLANPLKQAIMRHSRVRPFLDMLYMPKQANRTPVDKEVVVCRCEEVTAGAIRRTVALGCQGPNQVKAFERCGMGPCQGRLCGLTVTELIAAEREVSPEMVGYFRIRPPIKPIRLEQLAYEDQDNRHTLHNGLELSNVGNQTDRN